MSGSYFIHRNKCPACDAARLRTIYQSPFAEAPVKEYLEAFYTSERVELECLEGATYFLSECDRCGLIFQREIPDDRLMERLYEHWIDPSTVLARYRCEAGIDHYSVCAQEVMQIIAYFSKAPAALRFFDFGMGWGSWALMAKAFGCDVYGSELSEERIRFATSHGIKVITPAETESGRFDFINIEQVFEHIPEPLQTLRRLKDLLKPGGILKISAPAAGDIDRCLRVMDWASSAGTKNSLNPVAPLEHINCFRRGSLLTMAEQAGMEEVVMPMMLQYRYTVGWTGVKRVLRNLLLPFYRNVLKKPNYIFLRNR